MKHSISLRALLFLLCVMVVVVALVSLPVAAQEAPPAAPSVAAAASSSSTAPAAYNPAAAAFATPKPAAAASSEGPDPDRKWEVEFHGGGAFANTPTSGSSNLPNPGPLIPTLLGPNTSRAVPSFYFGDGALLWNQFIAAAANPLLTNTITPLDAVLTNSVVRRRNGGMFGARISRDLTPRFALEGTFDYSLGELGFTNGALANIQATSDSWQAALIQPNAPPFCGACTATTVTSTVALRDHQGASYMLTGAVNVNALTSGRWIPYFTVGVGFLGNTGDTPAALLVGNYQYTFGGITTNVTDTALLQSTVASHSFVGVVGAGLKYYVTPHWGIRGDVRDYISSNSISTLLSAAPTLGGAPPGCSIYSGSNPTIQDCTPGVVGQVATLSGTPIVNFHSFSGSGALHQIAITAGVFYRF
ncbi:MAG TPA: hypothetical protein VEG08_06535 [Terriglobales bacterium]|nr:hypothetical protein [Terriglobales bacterium]